MALTWSEIAKRDPLRLNLGCGNGCHPDQRYRHYVCVDLRPQAACAVAHDLTRPMPLPDGSVERIVSEHFLEHVDPASIGAIFAECHRLLKPGGVARFAVPDYNHPRDRHCLALGHDPRRRDHVTLPTIAMMEELVASSPFGGAHFYHYWQGEQFVERPIDYRLGFILRTPDNDPRNHCRGARQCAGRWLRDLGTWLRYGIYTRGVHRDTRRYHRLAVTSLVFDLLKA
jgi:predicted SAM-dependent methyltransferase